MQILAPFGYHVSVLGVDLITARMYVEYWLYEKAWEVANQGLL